MNIAIIDVAAESGGALSVLMDFLNFIKQYDAAKEHQWFVFTSKEVLVSEAHIVNLIFPEVKKSWLHRIKWENADLIKQLKKNKIDAVFSLQNTGLLRSDIYQAVYFHNILLLQDAGKYSLRKKEERKYAFYTKVIAPYTRWTLSKAKKIIVQTDAVRRQLAPAVKCSDIAVVRPNVEIPERFKQIGELR